MSLKRLAVSASSVPSKKPLFVSTPDVPPSWKHYPRAIRRASWDALLSIPEVRRWREVNQIIYHEVLRRIMSAEYGLKAVCQVFLLDSVVMQKALAKASTKINFYISILDDSVRFTEPRGGDDPPPRTLAGLRRLLRAEGYLPNIKEDTEDMDTPDFEDVSSVPALPVWRMRFNETSASPTKTTQSLERNMAKSSLLNGIFRTPHSKRIPNILQKNGQAGNSEANKVKARCPTEDQSTLAPDKDASDEDCEDNFLCCLKASKLSSNNSESNSVGRAPSADKVMKVIELALCSVCAYSNFTVEEMNAMKMALNDLIYNKISVRAASLQYGFSQQKITSYFTRVRRTVEMYACKKCATDSQLSPSDLPRLCLMEETVEEVLKSLLYRGSHREKLKAAVLRVLEGEYSVNAMAIMSNLPTSTLHPYVHRARLALGSLLPPQATGPTYWSTKLSKEDSELQRAPSTPPPNKSAINLDKLDEVITRILEDAYLDDVEKQKTYEATFAAFTEEVSLVTIAVRHNMSFSTLKMYFDMVRWYLDCEEDSTRRDGCAKRLKVWPEENAADARRLQEEREQQTNTAVTPPANGLQVLDQEALTALMEFLKIFLVEALREINLSTFPAVRQLLIDGVKELGLRLKQQINQLELELKELERVRTKTNQGHIESKPSRAMESHSRTPIPNRTRTEEEMERQREAMVRGEAGGVPRVTASSCAEMQLPAVKVITEKNSIQVAFLSALETICKVRVSPDLVPELILSEELQELEELWRELYACLLRLGKASDAHAVLALQPAAEAFSLVHAFQLENTTEQQMPAEGEETDEDATKQKLEALREKHRQSLNKLLRTNAASLTNGPLGWVANFPSLLDFDVKLKNFQKQLHNVDDRRYRGETVAVRVQRSKLLSESFYKLSLLTGNQWKSDFIITFDGEEGVDHGGILRDWFSELIKEIFNPDYALFITASEDKGRYFINEASHINPEHLDYFRFAGRIIAKAVQDNQLLDCYFTRPFYKHILNLPVGFQVEEFGVHTPRPLKPNGESIAVTDENKYEYVRLVCQHTMTSSIRRQLDAFLEGFYEVIPNHLIAMFNEQELELLISGLPNVDLEDLMANTEYRGYTKSSNQVQWFWRALRSFTQEDRAKFLQFVTGTSKGPLNGFANLRGSSEVQQFSIQMSRERNRLPSAATCFNQLTLPQYESYEELEDKLLFAIRNTEGFGFA